MWEHLIKDWQKFTLSEENQEQECEEFLDRLSPPSTTFASKNGSNGSLQPGGSPNALQLHSPFVDNIWSAWSPLSSPNSNCTGSQSSVTPPSPSFETSSRTQRKNRETPAPAMYDWCAQAIKMSPSSLVSIKSHPDISGQSYHENGHSSMKLDLFSGKAHELRKCQPKQASVPSTPSLSHRSSISNIQSDLSPFSPFVPTFRPKSIDGEMFFAPSSSDCAMLNGTRDSSNNVGPLPQRPLSPVTNDATKFDWTSSGNGKERLAAALGPSLNNHKMELFKTELCRNWEEKGYCEYNIRCQYAHGEAELRYVERDPRWKTKPCKAFFETGSCSYAKRCCFRHDLGNEMANASSTSLTRKPLLQRVGLLPETDVRSRSEPNRNRQAPILPAPRQYQHFSESGNIFSA